MGRSPPRCSKDGLNRGAWAASEDKILRDYIKIHGEGKWSNVAKKTGLKRCGKSCRLRWMNYLRPDIKRGNISDDEEEMIIRLHKLLGNRWSLIAGRLPGRTDNEIKNYWNTNLAKRAPDLSENTMKTPPTTTRALSGSDPQDPLFGVPKSVPSNKVFDHDHQGHDQNSIDNFNLEPENIIRTNYNETLDHHQSSDDDGSPSSNLSRENHNPAPSDLIMDFNVEDFCKFFDSDYGRGGGFDVNNCYDQTKNMSLVEVGDDDEKDIIHDVMCCKTEEELILPSKFPEKMKENWTTIIGSTDHDYQGIHENPGHHQTDMDSEFLTLASSFLESPDEEWPGYDLNISTHAG
ncbi:hypothetical protein ACOSP7_007947 [Xanthoceras sorbifolium]